MAAAPPLNNETGYVAPSNSSPLHTNTLDDTNGVNSHNQKHDIINVNSFSDLAPGVANERVENARHMLANEYPHPEHETPMWVQRVQRIRDRVNGREFFAEFIGSFLFLTFLILSVGGFAATSNQFGSYLGAMLALASSVIISLYFAFPISGGHISPAITVVYCMFRKFPLRKLPLYILAQFCGALVAAIVCYGIIAPHLDLVDMGTRPASESAIYIGYKAAQIKIGTVVLNELVGDIVFMFAACAVTEIRNPLISPSMRPVLVGLVLFATANSFGWTYWTLNPFRDFAPRVYLSAYYSGLWHIHGFWAVALFLPFLGHILGALLYEVCIGKGYSDAKTLPTNNRRVV